LTEAGVPTAGVRIVDGSGLSRLDRLTANAVTGILKAAWADPAVRPAFVAALPVAGVNGTLRPAAQAADPRARAGEDRHDERCVGALRLRQHPLPLHRPAKRAPALVLVGTARAGPLRSGPSFAIARAAVARRRAGPRASAPSSAWSCPAPRRRSGRSSFRRRS